MKIIIKIIYIIFSIICLARLTAKFFNFNLSNESDKYLNILFYTLLILWLFVYLFVRNNKK